MSENKEKTLEQYFYTAMPQIHLEALKKDDLYEQAFLKFDDKNDCEYCLNTTTWD